MQRFKLTIFIILFLCGNILAQLPHTFTELARTSKKGSAEDVAVDSNGTVFIVGGGLGAYNYSDSKLNQVANIDTINASRLKLSPEGHIIALNGSQLTAYEFNGSFFSEISHTDVKWPVSNIAIGPDGTIFMYGSYGGHSWYDPVVSAGLFSYSFDGSAFKYKAHYNDSCLYNDITVGPEGTIFLVSRSGGLLSYIPADTSFTKTASIDSIGANSIAVGSDGTLFLSSDVNGLLAYNYDGSTFEKTAQINDSCCFYGVEVNHDGKIFISKGELGIGKYNYNGTEFTNTTNIDFDAYNCHYSFDLNGNVFIAKHDLVAYDYSDGLYKKSDIIYYSHSAKDVALGTNGSVFLVNWPDMSTTGRGLTSYKFTGSSFINTSYVDTWANSIAVDTNGTVFSVGSGLRAYSYKNDSLISNGYYDIYAPEKDVVLRDDGTIFVANDWRGLRAYTFDGTSFSSQGGIDHGNYPTCAYGIAIGLDGTVFLANGNDGLRAYEYNSSFTNTAHIDDSINAQAVAVSPNRNTVFLANLTNGLRVYEYDGSSFVKTASYEVDYCWARDVAVAPDGTIFLAAEENGLIAFTYDGTVLTKTAQTDGSAYGVSIASDGTIFLAGGSGLVAYSYSGYTNIADSYLHIIDKYELFQNFPNPFNPSTTISYKLLEMSIVYLNIYNILGQKVVNLVSEKQAAGNYKVEWDASNFASGLYFCRLETDKGFVQSRKLILLK